MWKTFEIFCCPHFENKSDRNKELTAVEFEPGTPGSEITELPTKPQGSWRVQVIEKAICLWFLFFIWTREQVTKMFCTWYLTEMHVKTARRELRPGKTWLPGPALLQVWYLYKKILQVWDRYKRTLLLRLSSELKTKKDRLYVLEDTVKNLNRLKASASAFNLLINLSDCLCARTSSLSTFNSREWAIVNYTTTRKHLCQYVSASNSLSWGHHYIHEGVNGLWLSDYLRWCTRTSSLYTAQKWARLLWQKKIIQQTLNFLILLLTGWAQILFVF